AGVPRAVRPSTTPYGMCVARISCAQQTSDWCRTLPAERIPVVFQMMNVPPRWEAQLMTADEIQALIEEPAPPGTEEQIRAFEAEIGHTLPDDYRAFLARCSGGNVDDKCEYAGVSPDGEPCVHPIKAIYGVRRGFTYSLSYRRK